MNIKMIVIGVSIVIVIFVLLSFLFKGNNQQATVTISNNTTATPTSGPTDLEATIIAENLDTPWEIAFLPNNDMLFTERPGRVRLIEESGRLQYEPVLVLRNVIESGEGGLLGIAIHPNFYNPVFSYVYLYYTYFNNRLDVLNRVSRFTFKKNRLTNEQVLLDNIPGSTNHNGGRLKFGPDGYLYITTGDAENPSQAQDVNSLAGKILRITTEGDIPADNPFGNAVYSYGHRNPQGLAWDSQGRLWATEQGRSDPTGFDEVNLIEKGNNYGWPIIQGDEQKDGMVTPVFNSGAKITLAPAGADFAGPQLYFGGLKGEALYEAVIQDKNIKGLKEHFKGTYGRIREVVEGPDGMLYITTSNQDGRGTPSSTDDRIIRVKPIIKQL